MSTAMQVFAFQQDDVRVVVREGDPWFVAADVCACLGIGNPSQALARLGNDETTLITNEGGGGRAHQLSLVSESGLYRLIFTSRRPEAEAFRTWLAQDVIPAIRKTGRYEAPGAGKPTGDRRLAIMSLMAEEQRELVERQRALEKQVVDQRHQLVAQEERLKTIEASPPLVIAGPSEKEQLAVIQAAFNLGLRRAFGQELARARSRGGDKAVGVLLHNINSNIAKAAGMRPSETSTTKRKGKGRDGWKYRHYVLAVQYVLSHYGKDLRHTLRGVVNEDDEAVAVDQRPGLKLLSGPLATTDDGDDDDGAVGDDDENDDESDTLDSTDETDAAE